MSIEDVLSTAESIRRKLGLEESLEELLAEYRAKEEESIQTVS